MMLGSLGHRTPNPGRCYGETDAVGCQPAAARGVVAGAHHPGPVSRRVWAGAPERAAAGVDADRAGAVLGGRDPAGPEGTEPGLGGRARAARTPLPTGGGHARGVLPALPRFAARLLCRGEPSRP